MTANCGGASALEAAWVVYAFVSRFMKVSLVK